MEPILYLASFLESKGHRPESIEDEIVHLLKGMTNEVTIRLTLRDTRFHTSVNLKVYDSYVIDFSSKTAYIHKDVMDKLGLTDTDENIIEIETKSDKRTVANVLELRDVDKRRDNIIRLGGVIMRANLGLKDNETVTVRKAIKPIPADKVTIWSYPGQAPVGGYYLKKKLQGTPLSIGDKYVATTFPNSDSRWLLFVIKSVGWKEEYEKDFGGVAMITPETSFEEIVPEAAI
jgi:hypothetical protein